MEERRRLFIGGAWEAPSGDHRLEVISPHSEKPTRPMLLLDAYADIAAGFPWEERRPGVFGRELGREGLEAYVDLKAISGAPRSPAASGDAG